MIVCRKNVFYRCCLRQRVEWNRHTPHARGAGHATAYIWGVGHIGCGRCGQLVVRKRTWVHGMDVHVIAWHHWSRRKRGIRWIVADWHIWWWSWGNGTWGENRRHWRCESWGTEWVEGNLISIHTPVGVARLTYLITGHDMIVTHVATPRSHTDANHGIG